MPTMYVLVLWVDPCQDPQELELLMAMSSTPKVASPPAPEPSPTPSSCRPPSSSPPSSAKAAALPADPPKSVEGGDPISEGDKELLRKALAKIEELESRLDPASKHGDRDGNGKKRIRKMMMMIPLSLLMGRKFLFSKHLSRLPQQTNVVFYHQQRVQHPISLIYDMDLS